MILHRELNLSGLLTFLRSFTFKGNLSTLGETCNYSETETVPSLAFGAGHSGFCMLVRVITQGTVLIGVVDWI